MTTYDLHGKTAVITGGASGIGRAAAIAMAERGADIVVADVNDERLDETQAVIAGIGRRVLVMHCDVSLDADVERLAKESIATMGGVDIVMNNAGVASRGAFEEVPMADWEWIVGINLLGVVRGCRAFAPHLIERGSGYIVNTASVGGLAASTIGTAYVTTKHAVVGLSESLSLYLRPKGITVSVLCPGGVRTNIAENVRRAGTNEAMWGRAPGEGDATRALSPEQVAEILLDGMGEERFVIPTFPLAGPVAQRVAAIEELAVRPPSR